MMGGVKELEWTDPSVAVPSFLTIAMTVFTYSISDGIGFGFLAYTIIKLCTGKFKDLSITTIVVTILFAAKFLLA
jgi:AGZA family xanthine/uracil permease-like MFS transporter